MARRLSLPLVALLAGEAACLSPLASVRVRAHRSVPTPAIVAARAVPSRMLAGAPIESVSTTLAFADQAGNLAGTFFQASLLPYVVFLYFLGYEGNRTPKLANFGFQCARRLRMLAAARTRAAAARAPPPCRFLLLFVLSTVFTGIVTKSVYSSSLADVDYLHGAAEALLTTSNLYVGLGFRAALAGEPAPPDGDGSSRYPAFALFAAVVLTTALGATLGFDQHAPFLFGLGNLGANPLDSVLGSIPAEPTNALSLPTWAIHFSSVFEWLFAMGMVNKYADATGNDSWRYLTWGMLPLHASGVAACTYHFFYNSADVASLVAIQARVAAIRARSARIAHARMRRDRATSSRQRPNASQAGLTLLGNTTVAIAACLIALSNGWTIADLNPLGPKNSPTAEGDAGDGEPAAVVSVVPQDVQPAPLLAAELLLLTTLASYAMKYGEPALGLPFAPNEVVGWAICVAIPAGVAWRFSQAMAAAARA